MESAECGLRWGTDIAKLDDVVPLTTDEKNRYLNSAGKATELGARVAPTYKALTGAICKQLAHMDRVNDPVAIHYSHPSITAHWRSATSPLA